MVSSSFKTSLGKKLIAVALCVTAFVFLSISVFADTPIQPLQVITYSDTSTNVRISGTAERLHYNVDSFQVVFMNPPNNYGTACTPVLVSFRFYNSSDLPAYVGQAEFELTASSGTGAVNTIIYGYDQISTDLFVAESSYSTAEVGRIGIGASNDFAYYTGFVIPPRTSLYFSCIVYVNASAYAQNNTGATEDVNQVTLSSLNLYSNQISFSEDYPYHNQPVDFSSIIQAIEDLSDNVSTSNEMVQIIQLLTYNGTNPSFDLTDVNNNVGNGAFDTDFTVRVYRFVAKPYLVESTVVLDPSNDNAIIAGTKRYDITLTITEQDRWFNRSLSVSSVIKGVLQNNDYKNLVVDEIISPSFYAYGLNGYQLILYRKNIGIVNERYVFNKGSQQHVIRCHIDVNYDVNLTFPNLDLTSYVTQYEKVDVYAPVSEYYILRDLYNAYSSVNGLDDISDAADDITDMSESAHNQEQTYFTQNAQAIQQTGLSNYRFNTDQENGISSVSHDFVLLWNALGGFNSVYVFSLTLSLALMILRHVPGAISTYQSKQRAAEIRDMFKKGKN